MASLLMPESDVGRKSLQFDGQLAQIANHQYEILVNWRLSEKMHVLSRKFHDVYVMGIVMAWLRGVASGACGRGICGTA